MHVCLSIKKTDMVLWANLSTSSGSANRSPSLIRCTYPSTLLRNFARFMMQVGGDFQPQGNSLASTSFDHLFGQWWILLATSSLGGDWVNLGVFIDLVISSWQATSSSRPFFGGDLIATSLGVIFSRDSLGFASCRATGSFEGHLEVDPKRSFLIDCQSTNRKIKFHEKMEQSTMYYDLAK